MQTAKTDLLRKARRQQEDAIRKLCNNLEEKGDQSGLETFLLELNRLLMSWYVKQLQ